MVAVIVIGNGHDLRIEGVVEVNLVRLSYHLINNYKLLLSVIVFKTVYVKGWRASFIEVDVEHVGVIRASRFKRTAGLGCR